MFARIGYIAYKDSVVLSGKETRWPLPERKGLCDDHGIAEGKRCYYGWKILFMCGLRIKGIYSLIARSYFTNKIA